MLDILLQVGAMGYFRERTGRVMSRKSKQVLWGTLRYMYCPSLRGIFPEVLAQANKRPIVGSDRGVYCGHTREVLEICDPLQLRSVFSVGTCEVLSASAPVGPSTAGAYRDIR